MHKHIVWRNTGLPTVQKFAKNDTPCSNFDFCRVVNNARVFTSKFKQGWGEMFSCRNSHNFGNLNTTSVHDKIPSFCKKRFTHFRTTLNDCYPLGWKSQFDDVFNTISSMRCQFGGFNNNSIASSNCANQRSKYKLKWIIPRTNMQHHAIGFGDDVVS